MPHLINGIGTWYVGKKNLFKHEGTCEFCNRRVNLTSYDTRLWLMLVYIPVVPLGRKRILDSCPVCDRHRSMSLKQYYEMKEHDYEAATEVYQKNPLNAEAAGSLLIMFSQYQDLEAFEEMVPQIAQDFSANAEILSTIGEVYYAYSQWSKSIEFFEQSLEIADDTNIRLMLGYAFIRSEQIDQAASEFQIIIDKRIVEHAGTLGILAEAF